MFLINGGEVTWKSSKQKTLTYSTYESKYIETSEVEKVVTWLKNFFYDLGVIPSINASVEIFCHKEGAVSLTKKPKDHGKLKHILNKYHYVRK